ncbi:MAG: zinc-binding dehydrogenase [Bacteroidota bacterium]|nr:zinc-binding dehydrogenase [Bacteroidota bacterium]
MRALLCRQFGSPDTLTLENIPLPEPGENEVLIAVRACGVNFPDTLIIRNAYQFKPPLPFSPGGEVAGMVIATGKQVTHLSPGDRVLTLCGWGGMAEELIVDAAKVFPIPPALDFITAAGSLFTYGTSFHALKNKAALQPGETLLVLGAGGGVGMAAIELGKIMGARVIAAASSEEKLLACQSKGADYLINYSQEDLKTRLQEITGGKGVDVIYDPVGGNLAETALRSIAWKGRYLVVGFASGEIPQTKWNLILLKGCSVMGVFWGSFAEKERAANEQNLLQIMQWLIAGKLTPYIPQIYPLENAADAIQDMMDRKLIGKAVVKVGNWTAETAVVKKSDDNVHKIIPAENGKKIIQGKADVKNHIGSMLGPGEWLTVTQEMIHQFAAVTGDDQWIHTDTEKASQMLPGGKTIAHGYLIMSLVSRFLYDLITIRPVNAFVNYGINKARFISPVPVGSRIRLQATLSGAEDQPDGSVKLFLNCLIEIEGAEKPAFAGELISLLR